MTAPSSLTPHQSHWVLGPVARHPALLAACCVVLGVFIGDTWDFETAPLLILTALFLILAIALTRQSKNTWRVWGILAAILALIGFGAWRIAIDNAGRPSPSLSELMASNRQVELFARVSGVPFQKSSGWRVPIDLVAVNVPSGHLPVSGRLLLTSIPSLQGLRYGDFVRFKGRVYAPSVQRNPGGFDYAEYLHRQGFDATARPESALTLWPQETDWSLQNAVEPVRGWIRTTFSSFLDGNSQALLTGLLLGDTDRLPKSIYDAFRESGTSHLLAVSGANVWLVVGMLLLPMYWLAVPRWPRTIIALTAILLFSFLTRNEPSVVRASLMVALILIGQLLWRPVAPLNAVGAAGLIIMIFAPAHLFRPGFQLSFAAVIAILIAVARVEPLLKGQWRRKWVYATVMFLVASLAATVGTAPICAWHFGTVPVAGVFSNVLMVPLAGLTAHLGLILLPVQEMSTTAGAGLAWLTGKLLGYSSAIAKYFADFPWAVVSWPSPSIVVLIHLIVLAALLLSWRHRYQWFRPLVYYICLLLIVAAGYRLANPRTPSASVTLLDTGGQRAMVVAPVSADAVGVIDDPGLEDEIDQWVIQPFLRHKLGKPTVSRWESWRRLDSTSTGAASQRETTPLWERYFTSPDTDSLSTPRVWADRWRYGPSNVVMFRDTPRLAPLTALGHLFSAEPVKVLVVPANSPLPWTHQVIELLKPESVLFYGRPYRKNAPDETHAFWRLRHPGIGVYSSAVNGGVTFDFSAATVTINPTILDPL